MFQRLLLATEGSEFSAGATRAAVSLAAASGASLSAMTMVVANVEFDALAPALAAQAERDARATLEQVATQARAAGVNCETLLRRGDEPSAAILDTAKAWNADLVVVGRRGRRGLARWMVGDATVKVVGKAHCAVLVVPQKVELSVRRLLLATDGSRHAAAAARIAMDFARHFAAEVTVLSVKVPSHSEARRAEANAIVHRTVREMAAVGVTAQARVESGEVPDAVAATAQEISAGFILIGSHGRTGWGRAVLGSNTERIIGKVGCAVLVGPAN